MRYFSPSERVSILARISLLLGMGVSFLPRSGVGQGLANGALTVIPLTGGERVTLPTCLLIRRAKHYSDPVAAFLGLLKATYNADIDALVGISQVK